MVKRNTKIFLTVILGMLLSLTTRATAVPLPPAPEITVTDSVAPVDDLYIPFGSVTEGFYSDQTVTVTNDGNASLEIGNIAQADPLIAPFSILNDNCSGQTIIPSENCTFTVSFSPTTTGLFSDTFDIPSNDPDENPVTVNVRGTGTPIPVPDITVTDSIVSVNDLQMPFGDVTEGTSSISETVTISNTGSADLNVSNIQLTGTDTGEFILDVNGSTNPCGGTTPTIVIGGSCTVTVIFSPTTTGLKSANLEIFSDDPDEGTVNIALSGTGLSSVTNNPPSAPELVYPADGQTGLGTTVTFRWKKSTDPDGNTVTYDLYVCKDEDLTIDCITKVDIASLENKAIYYAGIGGVGLLLFGIVLTGSVRNRAGQRRSGETGKQRCSERKRIGFLIAIMVITIMLLVSCGGGGGSSGGGNIPAPSNEVTQEVSGLSTGTIYYWKVMAKDGKGGETDSDTRSFTTQ